MATEQKIPIGTTGENLRSFEQTTTAGVVQVEAVSIVDPTDTTQKQAVMSSQPVGTESGAVVRVAGTISLAATPTIDIGDVTVLNFPATQPVSGTFFQVTQPISAATLPLPTGAATSANQQTDSLTNTQLRAVPVPVSGTFFQGTQPVSGTVAATQSGSWSDASNKSEDSGHTTGDTGSFILGVRNVSQVTLTTTELDYSPISVDSLGNIIQVQRTSSVALTDTLSNTINLPTSVSGTGVIPVIYPAAFNGSNWDRIRGNISGLFQQGPVANDVAVAGNPLLNGFRASLATPTAVSADGDSVWGWSDRKGRVQVISVAGDDGDILCGVATSSGSTIITIPAGRTWQGYVTLSAAVGNASAGVAISASARVSTAGTNVVPSAADYLRVDLYVAASAAVSPGNNESGHVTTQMTVRAPAGNSVTLVLNTTSTNVQSASANGTLL